MRQLTIHEIHDLEDDGRGTHIIAKMDEEVFVAKIRTIDPAHRLLFFTRELSNKVRFRSKSSTSRIYNPEDKFIVLGGIEDIFDIMTKGKEMDWGLKDKTDIYNTVMSLDSVPELVRQD